MKRQRAILMLATLGLVLTGCESTPPIESRYYLLSSNSTPPITTDRPEQQPVLGIAPVNVADYLNNEGLVLRTTNNQLHIAQHHLWAEPPGPAIARTLQTEISSLVAGLRVENAQQSSNERWTYRLRLYIDQFQGSEAGDAVLSGFWRLDRPDTDQVISAERFLLTQAQSRPGYDAMVDTLRQLTTQLARQLSQQLPGVTPAE